MDEFIPVSPNGEPASCLEDFRKFSVKKLQEISKHYNENMSGKKRDLLMRTLAIFLWSQYLPSDSFMDHTTCWTYEAVFSRELSNAI